MIAFRLFFIDWATIRAQVVSQTLNKRRTLDGVNVRNNTKVGSYLSRCSQVQGAKRQGLTLCAFLSHWGMLAHAKRESTRRREGNAHSGHLSQVLQP